MKDVAGFEYIDEMLKSDLRGIEMLLDYGFEPDEVSG